MKKETLKVEVKSEALAMALGVKQNDEVTVECRRGVPVDRYWRNRLRDAKTDNSVEVLSANKPAAKPTNSKAEE